MALKDFDPDWEPDRGWAKITREMIQVWPHLLDRHRLLLPALLSFMGSGSGFPSQSKLAEMTGRKRRWVLKIVGELDQVGLVLKTRRKSDKHSGDTSCLYTLADLTDERTRNAIVDNLKRLKENTPVHAAYTPSAPEPDETMVSNRPINGAEWCPIEPLSSGSCTPPVHAACTPPVHSCVHTPCAIERAHYKNNYQSTEKNEGTLAAGKPATASVDSTSASQAAAGQPPAGSEPADAQISLPLGEGTQTAVPNTADARQGYAPAGTAAAGVGFPTWVDDPKGYTGQGAGFPTFVDDTPGFAAAGVPTAGVAGPDWDEEDWE